MKVIGIALYILAMLVGMISIGVNSTVYLIYKKELNKYLSVILPSIEVIVLSVFVVVINSSFNSALVFLIFRSVLQCGLFALFVVMPMFYCHLLDIPFKNYRVVFAVVDAAYLALSAAIVVLYILKTVSPALLESVDSIFLNVMSFCGAMTVLIRLKRIKSKFLRYNFLVINIFAVLCAIVYLSESTIFKTHYSLAFFILVFNIFFILPTLFNVGKAGPGDGNAVSGAFAGEYGITEREKEIILLLNNGLSYRDIGEKLFISSKTVETHVYSVYRKTGVKNRLQLLQLTRSGQK